LSLDQYSPPGTAPSRLNANNMRVGAIYPLEGVSAADEIALEHRAAARRTRPRRRSPTRLQATHRIAAEAVWPAEQVAGRVGAVAPDQQAPAVRAGHLGERFGKHGDVLARGGRP